MKAEDLRGLNMAELLEYRREIFQDITFLNTWIRRKMKAKATVPMARETTLKVEAAGGTVVYANPFPDGRSTHLRLSDGY